MDKMFISFISWTWLECILYRVLCMSLSWVLDGDQVVRNVDGSLIGLLPLSASKKLCIVLTEEVEHTEPGWAYH